jgi:transmembrane sensor
VALEDDEDEVARWAIRLDAGTISAAEQSALDAWLACDEHRAGALLRAQAALEYLNRGRALGTALPEEVEPAYHVSRRGLIGSLMAAGAAACVGAIMLFPREKQIDTQIGEIRQMPLEDGSVATLNTSSKVSVQMKKRERLVRLDDGEAWFRVAPDKARPFVVEAGEVRVRAVGTAFSVRRRDGGTDVLVTEGTVEAWVVGREGEKRFITAGSRGLLEEDAPIEVAAAPEQIDRALAWRSGQLSLNGETLDYAVAELNRYNKQKLLVESPDLGRQQLVGYFHIGEPENFAKTVAWMIGADVVESDGTIRIVPSKKNLD